MSEGFSFQIGDTDGFKQLPHYTPKRKQGTGRPLLFLIGLFLQKPLQICQQLFLLYLVKPLKIENKLLLGIGKAAVRDILLAVADLKQIIRRNVKIPGKLHNGWNIGISLTQFVFADSCLRYIKFDGKPLLAYMFTLAEFF